MENSFWNDFFANFFSDLLVGGLVGAFLAWKIGKLLSRYDRNEQRKEEEINALNKTLRYLEILNDEINEVLNRLPAQINAFNETGWGRIIRIPTPRWDVLKPSGELPTYLDPPILASIALFFDDLDFANKNIDLVYRSWITPNPETISGMKLKLDSFVKVTLLSLNQAQDRGKYLPEKISLEIDRLQNLLNLLENL